MKKLNQKYSIFLMSLIFGSTAFPNVYGESTLCEVGFSFSSYFSDENQIPGLFEPKMDLVKYLTELMASGILSPGLILQLSKGFQNGYKSDYLIFNDLEKALRENSKNNPLTIEVQSRILSTFSTYFTEEARSALASWIGQEAAKIESLSVLAEENAERSKRLILEERFTPIPAGKFKTEVDYEGYDYSLQIKLTHPFEMMQTLVTQGQWWKIFKRNPSFHSKGLDSTIVKDLDELPISLNANYPVENINWYSAAQYANELSRKHGLKPTYDFSEIPPSKYRSDGEAANGNLFLDRTQIQVKINAPHGNPYLAEGYRFPTFAEQEYVRTNLGKSERFFFEEDDIDDYEWTSANSGDRTHGVAEKLPLLINRLPLFDLYGNVGEFSGDYRPYDPKPYATSILKDPFEGPLKLENNDRRVWAYGSAFIKHGRYAYGARKQSLSEARHNGNTFLGFRLVRTLLPGVVPNR